MLRRYSEVQNSANLIVQIPGDLHKLQVFQRSASKIMSWWMSTGYRLSRGRPLMRPRFPIFPTHTVHLLWQCAIFFSTQHPRQLSAQRREWNAEWSVISWVTVNNRKLTIDIKSNQIITIPSAISKTGRHLASQSMRYTHMSYEPKIQLSVGS